MRPRLNFSITRILAGYVLAMGATVVFLALLLTVLFGPTWARVLAAVFLLLDWFS